VSSAIIIQSISKRRGIGALSKLTAELASFSIWFLQVASFAFFDVGAVLSVLVSALNTEQALATARDGDPVCGGSGWAATELA
jgi:hypothetical protein